MKNLFGFINFFIGLLALLVSAGILRDTSHRLDYAAAGLFAFAIAAACLWLAKESLSRGSKSVV
jgi:uncharacterized membrane protein YvlD (DUF360 family)